MERHALSSEQHDALRHSRLLLHFILGSEEEGMFKAFLENVDTAPPPLVLSFATKDEADNWLLNHPAPPHGAVIGVASERYHVAYSRQLEYRNLLRLPSEAELAQMEESEDEGEDAAEDETEPPNPFERTRFSLFELYRWACFHLHPMEQRISSPEEREAIRTTRIAFDFVMYVGEEHGFEDFLRSLHAARTSRPLQSFATREAAESWLETQPEPPPPAVVAIGGELYAVGYNRRREVRVLIRIPQQRELDAGPPAAV
ncbi:hypothetical protein [Archangium violaceum]|uniref:hypothetical protein n=1 Tax=Archangium violaceum TaxID=83451 RepID=UPI001269E17F|nr:hypothetical protein [Archangium violaceum]